jgi:hypothetical protein
MRERFVLLGLARARAAWFRTVGQWATAAMLPADFVRCVSIEELRARLRSGRAFSAVLIDGGSPGLDRDLIAEAAEVGVTTLVVDDGERDWRALGAAAVMAPVFSRDELLEVLEATSTPVGTATLSDPVVGEPAGPANGAVIAVTGPGGTGASTVSIALAQGLGAGHGWRTPDRGTASGPPSVLLADLCRVADQAMLHDSRVVVPSIQEVVEAHRTATPDRGALLEQTFEVPARRYRLLLGLRRPRHWVALRPRALESTLDSLQRLADVIVADAEADLEGEAETGSTDVEERNLLSRATIARAELVVLVVEPSMKGIYAAVRTLGEITAFGVPAERVLPVVNRSPRSPRARAELNAALGDLVGAGVVAGGERLPAPLHLPERAVEPALRDGGQLPGALARPLARGVAALRERLDAPSPAPGPVAYTPVTPGDLAAFSPQEQPPSQEQP